MVHVKRVVLYLLFGSNVCILRIRLLIRRQSQTGFFYCKGGSNCEGLWGLAFTVYLHGKSDIKQWASKRVKYCPLLPLGIRGLGRRPWVLLVVLVYIFFSTGINGITPTYSTFFPLSQISQPQLQSYQALNFHRERFLFRDSVRCAVWIRQS